MTDFSTDDLKIAKKRAKKHGVSIDDAKHSVQLDKNQPKAQELWVQFAQDLIRLGFKVAPRMKYTELGAFPKLEVIPVSLNEQKKVTEEIAKDITNNDENAVPDKKNHKVD